jgi:hypothetical protein
VAGFRDFAVDTLWPVQSVEVRLEAAPASRPLRPQLEPGQHLSFQQVIRLALGHPNLSANKLCANDQVIRDQCSFITHASFSK